MGNEGRGDLWPQTCPFNYCPSISDSIFYYGTIANNTVLIQVPVAPNYEWLLAETLSFDKVIDLYKYKRHTKTQFVVSHWFWQQHLFELLSSHSNLVGEHIDPIRPRQPGRRGDVDCNHFNQEFKNLGILLDLFVVLWELVNLPPWTCCFCISRQQGQLSRSWDCCGLRDPGNPLFHRHYPVLLQVQMQKMQKVLQKEEWVDVIRWGLPPPVICSQMCPCLILVAILAFLYLIFNMSLKVNPEFQPSQGLSLIFFCSFS